MTSNEYGHLDDGVHANYGFIIDPPVRDLPSWTIQCRVAATRWSVVTVEAIDHRAAIALAEWITGGKFAKIEE